MTTPPIPSHVPPHLVRDYDYTDMQGETDAFRHLEKLHAGPDLFYTPRLGGHWVVTRYADMEAILANDADFSSDHSSLPRNPFPLPLLESDAPIHAEYRNLLAPYFTPKSIGNLEHKAREATVRLINGFYARGECEFVRDFGQLMPMIILMNLLGLPEEDAKYLQPISEKIVRSGRPESVAAGFEELAAYIATQVVPARRANSGSDIFSALVTGKIQGGRLLTDQEIIALGCLLIGAGLDTVASTMGFVALHLARNPAQRQRLIDEPETVTRAIEEIIRRHTIANLARVATRDLELHGVTLKKGDVILVPVAVAGTDDRRYADPLVVDFDRADKKHIGFGKGPHQCIGAYLARTELRVFVTEWLKRIPQFDVKAGETPVSVAGKAHALRYLPLTWKVA